MPKANKLAFIVPGQPKGYVHTTQATMWTEPVKEYHKWKNYVTGVIAASNLNIPDPTKERPLVLLVKPYFKDGRVTDPENVAKAIADCVWPRNDRYTGRIVWFPLYDVANPRIEVEIKSGEILEEVE